MNPWVPFVAATATFIAALVALFKEDIVKKWRRPDLHIRMELKAPDCVCMPIAVQFTRGVGISFPIETWQGDCYYFRLWVSNQSDYLAERVQVYVKAISLKMGDGRYEGVPEFIPMNLRWADSPQPGAAIVFETMNPHMGKYCDFGTVSCPTNPSETLRTGMNEGESTFNLQTEVSPNSQGNRLKPAKYKIDLLVAASNAKPKGFTISLEWNGRFEKALERMFGESVKLKIGG